MDSNKVKGVKMTQSNEKQQYLTIREAAEYCRVSDSWLRNQVYKGRVKFTRTNGGTGKLLFIKEWLDEILLQGVQNG
ncbi:MAG: helix-turn-helix domain-containing protein [Candidatus Marinimicrobia bacterium]|jgi:excisionase family DNA binding protein|nr:helix-turn-helix domain-containing protein [Candidatus Neomarinimicrobiota bacterium]